MDGKLFSVSTIHTLAGESVAVLLIWHIIKDLPYVRVLSERILVVVLAEAMIIGTSPTPHSLKGWVVLLVNGLLVAATALGGWNLTKTHSNTKR